MRKAILAAMVLAACGDTASPGFSSGPAITSVSAATSGSSTTADTTSTGPADDSAGSTSSSSTGLLHDVGTAMDFGPLQPPGCKGKVDLLFVISRQGTMKNEQDQFLASFPGFIDTIEQKLEDFDVHVMTVNPDGKWPGWVCQKQSDGCQNVDNWPTCGPWAPDYDCTTYPDLVTPCDEELGAGLIFNAGGGAANKVCNLYGGNRYIISGEPDMKGALECIARVGFSGGTNRMGDAVIAALSPAPDGLNGAGGCNEGFLRDDALLVIVLIADFSDESWSHTKQQYEAIVAAKGDPSSVVMLAVVANAPGEFEPKSDCTYNAPSFFIFEELLLKFPHHVFGDTCTPSYAPFFAQTVDKIEEACGSFIPQ